MQQPTIDDVIKALGDNRVLISIFIEGTKHSQKPDRFVTASSGYYQSNFSDRGTFLHEGITSFDFYFGDVIQLAPDAESRRRGFETKWKKEVEPVLNQCQDYKYLRVEALVRTHMKRKAFGEVVRVYDREIPYVPRIGNQKKRRRNDVKVVVLPSEDSSSSPLRFY